MKTSHTHYFILAGIFFLFFLLLFGIWQDNYIDDVFYYYYLTSFVFDGDVDILNDFFLSNNPYLTFKATFFGIGAKGYLTNYFAIGSAILWCPFFLLVRVGALLISLVYPFPLEWVQDRYAYPYRAAISFGTLTFSILTLFLVYEICRFFFKRRTCFWAALGGVFATPLIAYIFRFSSMSHALSAFSVALLIYVSLRHRHFRSLRSYMLIGAVTGLATLVRWQNLIFAILPFALLIEHLQKYYKDKDNPRLFRREVGYSLLMVGTLVFLFSIQMFYWYAQLGSVLTVPQGQGFLNWFHPYIGKVLFSGWHGLYYCHPILIPATLGLVILIFRHRLKKLALLFIICFAIMTYINAIANDWFAGNAFGGRRFCSLIPVLAIGLGAFLQLFKRRLQFIPPVLVIVAITVNFFYLVFFMRNMADFYVWHELWRLRTEIVDVFPSFFSTLHLGSRIFAAFVLESLVGEGLVLILLGILGIVVVVLALERGWFRLLEKKVLLILVYIGAGIFILDAVMLTRAPAPDKEMLLFRKVLLDTTPEEEKYAIITKFIKFKWGNPLIHVYAYNVLNRTDLLPGMLDNLKRKSPVLWAKWVQWLPQKHVGAERKRQAAKYDFEDVAPPAERVFSEKYDKYRTMGLWKRAVQWLSRHHAYKPFDETILEELVGVCEKVFPVPAKAAAYEQQLQAVLQARVNNVLEHSDEVAPFGFVVLGGSSDRFRMLGELYEKNEHFARAQEFYDTIYEAVKKQYFLERSVIMKVTLHPGTLGSVVEKIMNLPKLVDSSTYHDVAEIALEQEKYAVAEQILMKAMSVHPYDTDLQELYVKRMKAYDVQDIPIEELMDKDIDSPLYWTVVAEQLNRLGRYDEALAMIKNKAMKVIPVDVRANFVYGVGLYHHEKYEQAFKHLKYALLHGENVPEYSIYIALCLSKLGQDSKALEILGWALKANPENKDVIQALVAIIKEP